MSKIIKTRINGVEMLMSSHHAGSFSTRSANNDDALSVALVDAIASRVDTPFGLVPLMNAVESDDRTISTPALSLLAMHTKKIEQLMMNDARFPGTDNYAIRLVTGRAGIYPHKAAEALLHRTNEGGSTTEAIEWLRNVIAVSDRTAGNNEASLIEALWGARIAEPLQLTSTIKLLPIADLPEGRQKASLLQANRNKNSGLIVSGLNHDNPPSVLVGRFDLKKAVTQMYLPNSWESGVPDNKAISALTEQFDDIAMVMTLTESHPVISAAIWMDYEDPDLKYYGQFLGSWSSRSLDVLPFSGQSYKLLDPVDVKTNVSNFLNLEDDVKQKIRVALERFNLALRRKKMGDAAIDLCIALESLVGGNETNEVTHKVTTRITRFLGGDIDQRTRTSDIVKATYNFRSAMVHNGQEPQKPRLVSGSKMNPREILAEAKIICVNVLKAVLSKGSIPDWQAFDIAP